MAARSFPAEPTSRCTKTRRSSVSRCPYRLCAARAFRWRSPLALPLRSISSASHHSHLAPRWLFLFVSLHVEKEIHQSGVEASGLREVCAMPGIGDYDLLCARDVRGERVVRSSNERCLVIAVDDQSRNSQVTEL